MTELREKEEGGGEETNQWMDVKKFFFFQGLYALRFKRENARALFYAHRSANTKNNFPFCLNYVYYDDVENKSAVRINYIFERI